MRFSISISLAAVLFSLGGIALAENEFFSWENKTLTPVETPPSQELAGTVAGKSFTVIFNSSVLSAQTPTDPLSKVWATSFEVPTQKFTTKKKCTTVLRFSALTDVNSAASVLISVNGKNKVFDYAFNKPVATGQQIRTVLSELQPGRPYRISIFAHVQRASKESAVHLQLDSLDVAVK